MEGSVYTVPMALFDFIPVILFGISGRLLMRGLYNKMSKGCFACLDLGVCAAFLAGFLKALYKLLIAAGVGEYPLLTRLFLPLQSFGLLLSGLSIVLMLTLRRKVTLAMAPMTIGFIGMMVLGLGGMCTGLSVVAKKMKKGWLIPVFVVCFFCYMGMGYLGARGGDSAADNWIEQGVNAVGQLLLLLGVSSLYRAGLREFKLS